MRWTTGAMLLWGLLAGCAGAQVQETFYCPEPEPEPIPTWICDDYKIGVTHRMWCTNTRTWENHDWVYEVDKT